MADSDLKLDRNQVERSVHALYEYANKASKRNSLVGDAEPIHLQLGLKKVPMSVKNKIIKVYLPNGMINATTDICLFVKDVDQSVKDTEPTITEFQELLAEHDIRNITEIIPLKKLKLEYKPYEAKRNLSNMYDVYLADKSIMKFLPRMLGKHFYGRKKIPISVNMEATDLKKEFTKVLGTSQCIISGRGPSSTMTVGNTSMSEDQLISNVTAAMLKLCEELPGGGVNIRCLHVKTGDSPSIPIYMSKGVPDDVTFPEPEAPPSEDEPEDVSTVHHGLVRVTRGGHVQIVNKATEAARLEKEKKFKKRMANKKIQKPRTKSLNLKRKIKTEDIKVEIKQEEDEEIPQKLAKKSIKKEDTEELNDSVQIKEEDEQPTTKKTTKSAKRKRKQKSKR